MRNLFSLHAYAIIGTGCTVMFFSSFLRILIGRMHTLSYQRVIISDATKPSRLFWLLKKVKEITKFNKHNDQFHKSIIYICSFNFLFFANFTIFGKRRIGKEKTR